MHAQDLYLRLTDPTGKHKTVISHHRVWDRKLFIASQVKLHETLQPNDIRKVTTATEVEYLAHSKGN